MTAQKSVLFIDDEAYRTRFYRLNLERAKWGVELCSTLQETRDILDGGPEVDRRSFNAAVIDLQMGRPEDMDDAAWENFVHLPGLWFLSRRARLFQNQNTAVAVLTNKNPNDFIEVLRQRVEKEFPTLRLGVWRKTLTPADMFPTELQKLMDATPGKIIGRMDA